MTASLIKATLAPIATELAKRGLDLLSGIFRGTAEQGADKVSAMIEEKTGIDVHDIAENKLTEEQWVQLKEFELAQQDQLLMFRQAIDMHELEMEKLHIADLAKARDTQTKRDENEDPFVRRFTYYYAYLITFLTFLFIFLVIFLPLFLSEKYKLPTEVWQIINTVLGFLLGIGLSAIIQFFYGSSQGSRDKAKQLDQLTSQKLTSREGN